MLAVLECLAYRPAPGVHTRQRYYTRYYRVFDYDLQKGNHVVLSYQYTLYICSIIIATHHIPCTLLSLNTLTTYTMYCTILAVNHTLCIVLSINAHYTLRYKNTLNASYYYTNRPYTTYYPINISYERKLRKESLSNSKMTYLNMPGNF